MSAFKYFTMIDVTSKNMEKVQRRGPGAKTTEVEVRMALVCASTDYGSLLKGHTNLVSTVRLCINSTHKCLKFIAHDFGVKLSACMCSHVSCPGWRNG